MDRRPDKLFSEDCARFSKECSGGVEVTAYEGDDVTLSLRLDPEAPLPTSVKWGRADGRALGDRFNSIESGGDEFVELGGERVTAEDGGIYWAQATNPWGQATATVDLRVLPKHPAAPHFLRRLTDLAVKVGTRTRFLVEVRSATDVRVVWLKDGTIVEEGERFRLLKEANFFCVDVAPVTLEDTGRWSCLAKNIHGHATCSCNLSVLVPKAYKKPEFVEELKALLTSQGTVSLECKVVGVPTPTLKWFKDDREIRAGDVFALRADPDDPTSLGTYTCQAVNCMGRALSTSRVHVLAQENSPNLADSILPPGPVPQFSKELRNEKVKIGGSLKLDCRVQVPPWPKAINWYNKEGEVKEGGRYHIMEDGLGGYSLAIEPLHAADDGLWKCVATSNTGVKAYTTCQVQMAYPRNYRKPKFLESLKAILTEEGLVSFECKVVGYPTPNLTWFKDGQELKPGDVYQLTGTNSLGSYCCIAKNCMGDASSTAELTIEDIQSQLSEQERMQLFSGCHPPRFIQGLKSMEAKINEKLRFTIQVSVSPEPSVLWFRDDEQIEESNKFHIEKELLGIYHLNITKLEFCDQAEWKCVATNEYGQSVTSCFLKLNIPKHYKKPKFLENLRAVLSDEGAVNLECKVIGVPQPVLKWYKDGKELKPGDIHRIISGQDGTCCLGTYTCEAHNCMGTASSSASLLGFEEREKTETKPPHIPLARNPSLSTIHEERTSQLHDTERSLTIDDRADEISFSFDGKEVSVSLYETPDLTEEEALQIVEMYADQISEHVSEHNIVDLPPMRFTKESSTSGNLMMEAVVIDVSQDYFSAAEDDLRTDADLEEFSVFEDPAGPSPDDEGVLDKLLERSLDPLAKVFGDDLDLPPVKPPRRKSDGNKLKKTAEEQKAEEEEGSVYTDALGSFHEPVGGQKPPSEVEKKAGVGKKEIKEEDSRQKAETNKSVPSANNKAGDKTPRKLAVRRKSSDSEKEDDSLKEFEKRKYLKSMQKVNNSKNKERKRTDSEMEDDSLYEFENRKSYPSERGPDEDAPKSPATKLAEEHRGPAESETEAALRDKKKKKKGIKFPPSENNEGAEETPHSERPESGLSGSTGSDLGIAGESPRMADDEDKSGEFDTAEAFDRSDVSVLESLTQSLQEIEKGLARVEAQVLTESAQELLTAKSSISVIESLVLPISEIKRGLESVEQLVTEECAAGQFSQSKMEAVILETLAQPITEFNRNLALVEQQIALEGTCESLLERTNQSIMETVVQPLQDFNREIALIQQHTIMESESCRQEADKAATQRDNYTRSRTQEETLQCQAPALAIEDKGLSTSGQEKITPEKKTLLKSLSVELRELEENAIDDLSECHEKLMDFGKILREKIADETDLEIATILKSVGDYLGPLKRLTNVTSKCISVIVEDYEAMGLGSGVPSSALMESLTKPLEGLKNCLQILEEVTSCKAHKEIRGIGIPILYKLTAPMDELETTIKLVENLSAHTAMEFLSSPLKKLNKAIDSIDLKNVNRGFVENLIEGVEIIKDLDKSVEIMMNCINSIDRYMPQIEIPTGNITKLSTLIKPLEEFQRHLQSLEEAVSLKMRDPSSCDNIYQMALDINKPLELMRMELSILQHQIEADHFGEISLGRQVSHLSVAMFTLTGSLENVQSSISTFYESIKRKPPQEPVHLRYVLYSLRELTLPLNQLCSTVMKAEGAIIPGSLGVDPFVGLKAVNSTLRHLNECNKSIKSFHVDGDLRPELKLAKMISDSLSEPLDLFQKGLVNVAQQINEKNKQEININLLRTLSRPFNIFQRALIEVGQRLSSETVPGTETFKLKTAIQELQRSILVIQDQVSFEYGDQPSTIESNMVTLGSLVEPLQTLLSHFSCIRKSISYENEQKLLVEQKGMTTVFGEVAESVRSLSGLATTLGENSEIQAMLQANPPLRRAFSAFRNAVSKIDSDFEKIQIGNEEGKVELIVSTVPVSLSKSLIEIDKIMEEREESSETAQHVLESFKQLVNLSLKPKIVSVIETFSKKQMDEAMSLCDAVGPLENLKEAIEGFSEVLGNDPKFTLLTRREHQDERTTRKLNELETAILNLRDCIIELNESEPPSTTRKSKLWNMKLTVDSLVYELDGMQTSGSGTTIADRFGNVLDCVSRIETDLNKIQCVSEHENPSLSKACKLVADISRMQYDTLKEIVLKEGHAAPESDLVEEEPLQYPALGKLVVALEKYVEEMKTKLSCLPSSSIQTAIVDISSRVEDLKSIDLEIRSAKTAEEEYRLCGDLVENALAIKKDTEKLMAAKKYDCDTKVVHNVNDTLTDLLGAIGEISTAPLKISFTEASSERECTAQEGEVLPKTIIEMAPDISVLNSILTSMQDMKYLQETEKIRQNAAFCKFEDSFSSFVRSLKDNINIEHSLKNLKNLSIEDISRMKSSLGDMKGPLSSERFQSLSSAIESIENGMSVGDLENFNSTVVPALQMIMSELKFNNIAESDSPAELKQHKVPEKHNKEIKHSEDNYIDQIADISHDLETGLLIVERAIMEANIAGSPIKTIQQIATPIAVLCDYIESVGSISQFGTLDELKKTQVSLLKNLAEPIAELKQSVELVQELVISDDGGNVAETNADIENLILAIAEPIREVKKNIAVIKGAAEAPTRWGTDSAAVSPLLELKEAVACLVESQVVEREGSLTSATAPDQLKLIASPVLLIHEQLSAINNELTGSDLSESVAKIYEEIRPKVRTIQNELAGLALGATTLTADGSQQNVAIIQSLVQPLLEACGRINLAAHSVETCPSEICELTTQKYGPELKLPQQNYIERIAETSRELEIGLLKVENSLLQAGQQETINIEAIATPVTVLSQCIERLSTIPAPDNLEEMKHSPVTLLKNMSEPIAELKRSVAQVQEIMSEDGAKADEIEADIKGLVLAIAEPIRELNKNIAAIKVLTDAETGETKQISPTDKAFASPLLQLKEAVECLVRSKVIEKEGSMGFQNVPGVMKAMASPIFLIHEHLSTIDSRELLETTSPLAEKSLSDKYKEIATQVSVLAKELAVYEQTEALGPSGTLYEKAVVRSLTSPLLEACKNVASVMEELEPCPAERKESIPSKFGPKLNMPQDQIVDEIVDVSRDLEVGLLRVEKALLQADMEQRSISSIEEIAAPVAALCDCIGALKNVGRPESSPIALLKNMEEPIAELKRSVTLVQDILPEGGESPANTDEDVTNLILAIAEPVREIRKNISVIKQVANVDVATSTSSPAGSAVASPLLELKEAVDCLVRSQIVEKEGTISFKNIPDLLKAIARPIIQIHKHLSTIEPEELARATSEELFKGKYKDIAPKVHVLLRKLSVVEQQEALSPVRSQPEKAIILSITQPLLLACKQVSRIIEERKPSLAIIEQSIIPKSGPKVKIPNHNYIEQVANAGRDLEIGFMRAEKSLLDTDSCTVMNIDEIATPVAILSECIENLGDIQFNKKDDACDTVALVKKMAEPVAELRWSVAHLQGIIQSGDGENSPEAKGDITDLILSIAEPIRQLKKYISDIKQEANKADLQQSEVNEITTNRVSVSALLELKEAVDCLVNSAIIQQEASSILKPDFLTPIAHTVLSLHKQLSSSDSNELVETTKSPEFIKQIATHVNLLLNELAAIEKQEALSPLVSEQQKAVMCSLTQPLKEACKCVSVATNKLEPVSADANKLAITKMSENDYMEYIAEASRNLEIGLLKFQNALLQPNLEAGAKQTIEAILAPVNVLCQGIEGLNDCPGFENKLDEMILSPITLLKRITEPVAELKQSVAQVQEIMHSEIGGDIQESQNVTSLILAIAEPIRELKKNIAVIKEMASVSEKADSIPISFPPSKATASPLLELKEAVDCLIQSQVIEHEGTLNSKSAPDLLKAIASPVMLIHQHLSTVESSELLESASPTVLKDKYNEVSTQVEVLQRELSAIEQQEMLHPIPSQPEKAIILSLAQPLLEACKHVSLAIEKSKPCTIEIKEDIPTSGAELKHPEQGIMNEITEASRDLEIGLLKVEKALLQTDQGAGAKDNIEDLSNSIQIVCQHMETLKTIPLSDHAEEMRQSSVTLVKSMAEPLTKLKHSVQNIQEITNSENGKTAGENDSGIKEVILAIAEPIRELNKNIAAIKLLSTSVSEEVGRIPTVPLPEKAFASPLLQLKEAVECLVQSNVIEKEGILASEEVPDLLKTISGPVLLIREHLSTVDNSELLGPNTTESIDKYNEIATQVRVLEKELAEVECQEALSPGSKSQKAIIRSLAQPLLEACKLVSLTFETSQSCIVQPETECPTVEQRYVEQIAEASHDLEVGLLKIEKSILEAESGLAMTIDELVKPVTALCKCVEIVNSSPELETVDLMEPSPLSLLKTMAEPIIDMKQSVEQIQEMALESSGQVAENDADVKDLILAIAQPIRELRKNVAVIEKLAQVTYSPHQLSSPSTPERAVTCPFHELKEAVRCLIESDIFEQERSPRREPTLLKVIATPVLQIHDHLSNLYCHAMEEHSVLISPEEKYNQIAAQLHVIQKELAGLERERSSVDGSLEKSVILSITQPLLEACRHVVRTFEPRGVTLKEDRKLTEQNCKDMFEEACHGLEVGLLKAENAVLKSDSGQARLECIGDLADTVAVLCSYVEGVHEAPKSESVEEISRSPLSLLKTLAEPIREVNRAVTDIREVLILETEGKDKSVKDRLLAIAEPIRELEKNIAVIHKQPSVVSAQSEAVTCHPPAASSMLVSPLLDLKEAVDCLVESNVVEHAGKTTLKDTPDLVKVIARPVLLIHQHLSDKQGLDKVTLSNAKQLYSEIATPVRVIQKELSIVQQENYLSPVESHSEKHVIISMTEPLLRACELVARIVKEVEEEKEVTASKLSEQRCVEQVVEVSRGMEVALLKVENAILHPHLKSERVDCCGELAKYVSILCGYIDSTEKIPAFETVEQISHSPASLVKTLEEPVREISRSVAQMQHILLSEDEGRIKGEILAIAEPVRELKRNIAVICQQANATNHRELSSLSSPSQNCKTDVSPLLELKEAVDCLVRSQIIGQKRLLTSESLPELVAIANPVLKVRDHLSMIDEAQHSGSTLPELSDKYEEIATHINAIKKELTNIEKTDTLSANADKLIVLSIVQPLIDACKRIEIVMQENDMRGLESTENSTTPAYPSVSAAENAVETHKTAGQTSELYEESQNFTKDDACKKKFPKLEDIISIGPDLVKLEFKEIGVEFKDAIQIDSPPKDKVDKNDVYKAKDLKIASITNEDIKLDQLSSLLSKENQTKINIEIASKLNSTQEHVSVQHEISSTYIAPDNKANAGVTPVEELNTPFIYTHDVKTDQSEINKLDKNEIELGNDEKVTKQNENKEKETTLRGQNKEMKLDTLGKNEDEKISMSEAESVLEEGKHKSKGEEDKLERKIEEEKEREEKEAERLTKEGEENLKGEVLAKEQEEVETGGLKEEAKKLKKEYAEKERDDKEAERVRQEEEKLKKENEEKERQEKEVEKQMKQDKEALIKKKEEQEREAKELKEIKEKERKDREEKEAEQLRKEEEKKLKKEKKEALRKEKEAERLRKDGEEKLKKEREEKEAKRLKQEEEERLKKENEEKSKKENEEKVAANLRKEEETKIMMEKKEKLRKEKEASRIKEEEEKLKKKKEEEKKQQEADKLKKEKEERERKEKEAEEQKKKEEERLKNEKEEKERKEKEAERLRKEEEEERLKKEDEEKERKENEAKKQKKEEEKLKKENEEKEMKDKEAEVLRKEKEKKLKKEKKEKLRKEKEAERIKQEETEKVNRDKEEQEKKQKEADKLKQEEEERLKKENEEKEKKNKEAEEQKKKEEILRIEKAEKEKKDKEAEEQKKKEEERLRIEKEEKEKKDKEAEEQKKKEEDRLRIEKEEKESKEKEAERLRKEEEERLKKENEEKERKENEAKRHKKEEEEKLKKENEEKEAEELRKEKEKKLKKEKKEKLKKEKEAERKKKEEQEKLKKDKEEQEKKQKEADKLKQEEEERLKKENEEKEKKNKEAEEQKKKEEILRIEKAEKEKKDKEAEEQKKKEEERLRIEKEEKEKKDKEAEEQKKKEEDRLRIDKEENEKKDKDAEEQKKKEEERLRIEKEEKGAEKIKGGEEEIKKDREEKENEKQRKEGKNKSKKEKKENVCKEKETERQKEGEEKLKKEADENDYEGLVKNDEKLTKDESVMKEKDEILKNEKEEEENRKHKKDEKLKKGIGKVKSKKEVIGSEQSGNGSIDVSQNKCENNEAELENSAMLEADKDISSECSQVNFEYSATCQIQAINDENMAGEETKKIGSLNSRSVSDSFRNKLEIIESGPLHINENEAFGNMSFNTITREDRAKKNFSELYNNNILHTPLLSKKNEYICGLSSQNETRHLSKRPYESLTPGKPSFCGRLVDRTVAQGSTVRLTCSVIGEPEPVISWLKDGFAVSKESGSMIYNRYKTKLSNGIATLEISKVVLGDAGQYTCVASNSNGQTTTSSTLKIFADYEPAPYPPVFTKTIKDIYKFREDELQLECKVRAHPAPTITWLHNGNTLPMTGRYQQSFSVDGVCCLTISNPEVADSGSYTCRAQNSICTQEISNFVYFAGREEYLLSRGRLSRNSDSKRPQFTSFLTDRLVPTGGTIALHVHVSGFPKPDVTWLRGERVLPKSATSQVHYFEDSGVYSLVVSDASSDESGVYTCRAVNQYGHATTTAQIEVLAPGKVKNGKPAMFATRPNTKMTLTSGEDFTLAFHVSGDPRPQVTWMKGVTDITNSGRTLKESFGDYVRLTMKRVTAIDAGTYFVIAKNLYGTDRAFVTIKIRERARSLTPTSRDSRDIGTILKDVHESVQFQHKGKPWKKRALYWWGEVNV